MLSVVFGLVLAFAVSSDADGLIYMEEINNGGKTAMNASGAFLCSPNAFFDIYENVQEDQDVLLSFQFNDMPVEQREIPSYVYKTMIEKALMPLVGPHPMFKHLGEGTFTITTTNLNDQPAIHVALTGHIISEPIL